MKAVEITSIIEKFAPLSLQESWDNSGYCIGSPTQEVSSAIVALDCTPKVVDLAIECGADMIITHHPLIFGGVKKISIENNLGYVIYKAIQHGMVVYSCHTNMDKVIDGVSGLMASRLGLSDIEILSKGDEESGLGVVGLLPEGLKDEEFAQKVKEVFSVKSVRCSSPKGRVIKKVALCGGSGKSLIKAAQEAGADAYITGDISYHDFLTEDGFFLVDIGHYESEIDVVEKISSILKEKLPTFAVRTILDNNNLVYYI